MPRHSEQMEDIPIVIGGKEYRTENVQYQVMVSSLYIVRNKRILGCTGYCFAVHPTGYPVWPKSVFSFTYV